MASVFCDKMVLYCLLISKDCVEQDVLKVHDPTSVLEDLVVSRNVEDFVRCCKVFQISHDDEIIWQMKTLSFFPSHRSHVFIVILTICWVLVKALTECRRTKNILR